MVRVPPLIVLLISMSTPIEDGPEALLWLRKNGHEAALASNRFATTSEAIQFVEGLYEAGAIRVWIPQQTILADDEELLEMGGPYSDTLFLELPDSGASPQLENIYRSEATSEGFDLCHDPLPIIEDRYLVLWWD
jgi:hypothetical protein